MAVTITKQVLHEGPRNAVIICRLLGDGAGDVTTTLIDISADLSMGPRTEVMITEVVANLSTFAVSLLWDATTDVRALDLAEGDSTHDFTLVGGLRNNAGAGKTGDIVVSTDNIGSAFGTIRFWLKKVDGDRPIG